VRPLNHCVLVVDDDPGIRLLLVTFLRRRGLRTLEARDGGEALAQMRTGHPDLAILDLMMPEVSGWDVLRVRAADPALRRIPTIVVTATNECDVAAHVLDKEVYAVIEKPFDLDALMSVVMICLDHDGLPTLAAA
jgi:two-component system, OmpR family, response regulator